MYFAVIGDIINSKGIVNRAGFQKKLGDLLNRINSDYYTEIAANFIITLGDEFQGLLTSPAYITEIIEKIKFAIYPVKARFGIGIGGIDTEISREMAIGADGPAYYHARSMINDIKANEKGKMSVSSDIKVSADGKSSILNLINCNLSLCSFIESKWTNKQRALIEEDLLQSQSQRKIASKFNLAQSSVQRRFKSAGYYDYLNAQKIIKRVLIEEWGAANVQ